MPRIRITLRWLMVLVLMIALGLAVESGVRRRGKFLALAAEHAAQERRALDVAANSRDLAASARTSAQRSLGRFFWSKLTGVVGSELELEAARSQKEADYHGRMREKYERAARYPWFRVEADPPAPW